MEDIYREFYITDVVDHYHELIEELSICSSTSEFKNKVDEINKYISGEPYVFGEGSKFISPGILENIEVLKITEKIWRQQVDDKISNRNRFWLGLILGAVFGVFAGVIANYCYIFLSS